MIFLPRWNDYVTTELISADIPGALGLLQREDFQIWDLEIKDQLTMCFKINRKEWNQLRSLCQKRGEQLTIQKQEGIYWILSGLRARPILVVGMAFLLLFTLWVPGRIFFVKVEGNVSIPSEKIVETATHCGINFGASRREVRSERMKNALLQAMPALSWAGVNTHGCTAVITVREKVTTAPAEKYENVSSIVATRDGVIREMTVLRGKGLCAVGEAVKAGQVLISGYTDCGLAIRAEQAKGEIFGETNRCLEVIAPIQYVVRSQKIETKQKISLIIGKKRINFSNSSGISGVGCAKIYEEKYISLPGGFILPVAIAVETWTFYNEEMIQPQETEQLLKAFAKDYLLAQMRCGKILLADEILVTREGFAQLTGVYHCYEMLGITRIEENIPEYVKNS